MAQSLTCLINDLAAGRVAWPVVVASAPLTEFDLFIQRDDILASLHQLHVSARNQHDAACREYGADSPMADIAADREDSAWCAMQTRLMELRAQGDLMRAVQKELREIELSDLRAKQEEKDKHALEFYHRLETARLVKERNKASHIYEWLAILMILQRSLQFPFQNYAGDMRLAA